MSTMNQFGIRKGGRPVAVRLLVPGLALAALLSLCHRVDAQGQATGTTVPSETSGFGFGARALGMGGAFIAIADDASAASWNPGGIGQLTSAQLTLVGSGNTTSSSASRSTQIYTVNSGVRAGALDSTVTTPADERASYGGLDFASYVQPLMLGKQRLVLQASYSRLGRGASSDASATQERVNNYANRNITRLIYSADIHQRTTSSGGLNVIAVGAATSFGEKVFFGASVEFWNGTLAGTNDYEERGTFLEADSGTYRSYFFHQHSDRTRDIGATAFSAGLLVKPVDWMSIGAVYRRGFKDSSPQTARGSASYIEEGTSYPLTVQSTTSNPDVQWPNSYGVGVAVRPVSVLTLSCDVTRTQFDNAHLNPTTTTNAARFPNGQAIDQNDQTAFRAGVEYLLAIGTAYVPVRAGFYSIPTATPLLGSFDADPEARFSGVTAGIGVVLPLAGDRKLLIDLAGVSEEVTTTTTSATFKTTDPTTTLRLSGDAKVHNTRLIGSLIVYF